MNLNLPLSYRRGPVLLLDDDADYLDMLGAVLPTHLPLLPYTDPAAFLQRMQGEAARWMAEQARQQALIDRWREGQGLLAALLREWVNDPFHPPLAQACVVDYAMGDTNGLDVLKSLPDWPGMRILLTGQADDRLAVQAFNQGLIDQFIGKHAPDAIARLRAALALEARLPRPVRDARWCAVLRSDQQALLQAPAVVQALQAGVLRQWDEYVVLGEPFGMLGRDAAGHCQWLQLEATAALDEPAELAAAAGLDPALVRAVRAGQRLPAVELHQQLGLSGRVRTAPAFALDGTGLLTAALFPLAPQDLRHLG